VARRFGRDHDHRRLVARVEQAQFAHKAVTVHAWHVDVHHIEVECGVVVLRVHALQRLHAVAGLIGKPARVAENLAVVHAHGGGVVDDEYSVHSGLW